MGNDMDGAEDRRREARLRRAAAGMGLALRKSRTREPRRMDFGCYRIVDGRTGRVLAGTFPYAYSLSLDAVEEALGDLLDNPIEDMDASGRPAAHGCAGSVDSKWV